MVQDEGSREHTGAVIGGLAWIPLHPIGGTTRHHDQRRYRWRRAQRRARGKRGWQHVLHAARFSIDGFAAAWHHEDAFRQELILATIMNPVAVIPAAILLPLDLIEKIQLIVERLNSAIEAAIERDSCEINAVGKRAKDMGRAAVMLSLLLVGGTWVAMLARRVLH